MKLFYCLIWLGIFFCRSASASLFPGLDQLIQELPEYKNFSQGYQVEKIENGLTHHNFKVVFPTRTYFVRLGCDHAELLGLNDKNEYICTQIASSLGLAPEVILYMPKQNVIVSRFIESRPPEKKLSNYQKILASLKLFHQSGQILPTTFCPYQIIDLYYRNALILRNGAEIPHSPFILSIVKEIETFIPEFRELAPCHLDLYNYNFLDDGKKIWIVDWEYSSMADPLYDLATLISSDRLSIDEMQILLELYTNCPTKKDFAYLYLMTILADVRWYLWNYIQAEVSLIQSHYLEFADANFRQILQKTTSPEYRQYLQMVKHED